MIDVGQASRSTGKIRVSRNVRQREKRLRNVEMLGQSCSICGTTEKLEIHHSWYDDGDAGTHSNHDAVRKLLEKEPDRFACLCHRCNVLVGHIHASMRDGTHANLTDEVDRMVEGRKNHSGEILTAGRVLTRQVKCASCDNMISVRGQHQKKFCSKECVLKNRRETRKDQRQYQSPATLKCAMCPKTFQITTGNQTTCSPECRIKRAGEVRAQRNLQEKEARLRNINLLGGRCRVCNTEEKLEVNHRWYVEEDRVMRSKHTSIEKMIEAKQGRFSCLCHRCNVLVGHIHASKNEGTYGKVEYESRKMLVGRESNPHPILIAYSRVSKRQIRCDACGKALTVRGQHGKRFCNAECKKEYYQRPDMKAQRKGYNKAYYRRLNPPKILNCIVCKNKFEQKAGGQLSCSEKCADERTGELKRQYARERRLPKFFTCGICGIGFQRKDGSKACSAECKRQLMCQRRQTQYKRLKELRDANAAYLTCEACGKKFRKKPGPAASACSDACKGELRRRKYREKHPPTFVNLGRAQLE